MFETRVTVAEVAAWVGDLARLSPAASDAERVDRLRVLEELKAAAAAAQAVEAAALAQSQEQAQRAAGVRAGRVGLGVGHQVGLAMRASPHRGRRFVSFARILLAELPHTFAALREGRTTEHRARLVAIHTIWLDAEGRSMVDATLAPRLEAMGDAQVEAEVKRLAYGWDPHGYTDRLARAEGDRRVTLRPAPETMTYLTGLLPVTQGVAAYATLDRDARTLAAQGDPRSRGQIMADLLVQRLTGATGANDAAEAGTPAGPVEIRLVMDTDTLLGEGDEPAHLEGYGPVPAPYARRLVRTANDTVWLRRLFTTPETGALVGADSTRRTFTGHLRELIVTRDQICRTPWCDAPIRHADHITPAAEAGPTALTNGQGLCEACNYAKQAPGWRATGDASHVVLTTPTGHHHRSRPPPLPGSAPPLVPDIDDLIDRLLAGTPPDPAPAAGVRPRCRPAPR